MELVEGVKKLTNLNDIRFRYFKSFKSLEATVENLENVVPKNKEEYNKSTTEKRLDNFSEFFKNSFADEVQLLDESLTFKKIYSGPVSFTVIDSGPKQELHTRIKGPMMLESKDIAETLFLTKYIGNYNINKIGDSFVFENSNWAVALKRK
jgi:hypothetical protein